MRIASSPASTSPATRTTSPIRRLGGAATRAPLELLHIIDRQASRPPATDHSGAIGFDAQEKLLDKLSAEDEQRVRAARDAGRAFLTRCVNAPAAGVAEVDIRQRHGELEETLLEQEGRAPDRARPPRPLRRDHTARSGPQRGARGARPAPAHPHGHGGLFREPKRVMVAFDGGAVTRRGVDMVAASPLFRDLPILLFMSGRAGSDARRKLSAAEAQLQEAGLKVEAELVPGDAETVIAGKVRERDIDLLIMGAFGHSPLRSLLFGSKTADLLRSATIPTLLLR
jgi:nucleotide-binding universal stress UspA family protein